MKEIETKRALIIFHTVDSHNPWLHCGTVGSRSVHNKESMQNDIYTAHSCDWSCDNHVTVTMVMYGTMDTSIVL